jgi:hypothetical protein
LASARVLRANKPKATHPDDPVNLLYYQAIELYLKAFLRLHGHTAKALASRKFGHDFGKLADSAAGSGLRLKAKDKLAFHFLTDTDAVANARYIKTGFARRLTNDRLDQLCRSLRHRVGNALKAKGEPVRWILPLP